MTKYRELPFLMPDVVRDFVSRIKFSSIDECWIFGNCKSRPQFYINGKGYIATRIAYKIFKGVDNPRLMMCHKCDNPPCVNPNHLYPGNGRENYDDQVRRNRRQNVQPDFSIKYAGKVQLHPDFLIAADKDVAQ